MRRSILFLSLMVLLSSCTKFMDDEQYYVSYGNLGLDGSTWFIHTDYGNRLNIVDNGHTDFNFVEGTRVVASYQIEGAPVDTTYNIKLSVIIKVLTKAPLTLSTLTPEQVTAVGDDPINLKEAWFGRGYLNVTFELFRNDPSVAHYINLVYNDTASTDETMVFNLRHNAYDDLTSVYSFGRASFDITSLIPDDESEIDVVLNWVDYYLVNRSVTGTFNKYGTYDDVTELEVKREFWDENITTESSLYE